MYIAFLYILLSLCLNIRVLYALILSFINSCMCIVVPFLPSSVLSMEFLSGVYHCVYAFCTIPFSLCIALIHSFVFKCSYVDDQLLTRAACKAEQTTDTDTDTRGAVLASLGLAPGTTPKVTKSRPAQDHNTCNFAGSGR